MDFKRILVSLLIIFLIMVLSCPAVAQMKRLYKFKAVEIPFNLKHEDSIIQKGKYDLEFLRQQAQPVYYFRIIKGRKKLCLVRGEQLAYKTHGTGQLSDPNIPENPTLRIKKNPKEKILYIIFETGKKTRIYPFVKVRFKMEYE